MIVTFFLLSTFPFVLADVPLEVFSPLIEQKILATYDALPSPIKYPQYTSTSGDWMYFDPNTWTSAFFPSSLYLLNTRAKLCGGAASNDLVGTADLVDLARSASTALLSIDASGGVEHDVGFISFAFVEELAV